MSEENEKLKRQLETANATIATLEAKLAYATDALDGDHWIYLTDDDASYPEIDEEVNVWLDYTRRNVATMRYGGKTERGRPLWFWHNSDETTTLTPKAWKPLPKPPG